MRAAPLRSISFPARAPPAASGSSLCRAFACAKAKFCASARCPAARSAISLSKAALTSLRCWGANLRLHAPDSAAWRGVRSAPGDILPLKQERTRRPPGMHAAVARCWRRPRTSGWFSAPRTTISATKVNGRFLESVYTVSPASDRMGMRLAGPALEHAKGYNIVSDGTAPGLDPGARQRPADRAPRRPANNGRLPQDRHRYLCRHAGVGAADAGR